MPKFYETDKFRSLEKKWNDILDESGFLDIEKKQTFDNQKGRERFYKFHITKIEENHEYLRLITNHIHQEGPVDPLDFTVMVLRGDGLLINQIANDTGLHRQTIRFIVRRYEHQWGMRFWTLEQRNLTYEPE